MKLAKHITTSLFLLALAAGTTRAQSISNASFEANTFNTWPGYASANGGTITGWTITGAGVGLNPAPTLSPFADNGAVPNGTKVAFIQSNGVLSTTITGLQSAMLYRVTFRANQRSATGTPYPSWSVNNGAYVNFSASPAVGGANPYYTITGTFTATGLTAALAVKSTSSVDAAVLLDDFRVAQLAPDIAATSSGTALEQQVVVFGSDMNAYPYLPVGALSNVVDVKAGQDWCMALKNDGTVVAWGDNTWGGLNVPAYIQTHVRAIRGNFNNGIAILDDNSMCVWGFDGLQLTSNVPAGVKSSAMAAVSTDAHALAVKTNGQLVGWGYNHNGVLDIPAWATNGVSAVAASFELSLALRNGGVVAWGNDGWAPGLVPGTAESGVKAIAACGFGGLALKTNGECVVWGLIGADQPILPDSVKSNVVAISDGGFGFLALRADGGVTYWSTQEFTVPANLQTGVVAIGGGGFDNCIAVKERPALYFGSNVVMGSSNTIRTITLKNTGEGSPLIITNITFSDSGSPQFSIPPGTLPITLANNASTNLVVRYKPNLPSPAEVIMRIQSNDPNESDLDLKLTGSGRWPTQIEIWRFFNFGNPIDEGSGADTNDFDGDGVVNLIEYAFKLEPTNAASSAIPVPHFTNGDFAPIYSSPPFVTDITYRAEWTPSLTNIWLPLTNASSGTNYYFGRPGTDSQMFLRQIISNP